MTSRQAPVGPDSTTANLVDGDRALQHYQPPSLPIVSSFAKRSARAASPRCGGGCVCVYRILMLDVPVNAALRPPELAQVEWVKESSASSSSFFISSCFLW